MKHYDVFLSWTGNDRDLKNKIREALEKHNFPCYDSDRDCRGDYSENFVISLDNSDVYFLILTNSLFKDPYSKKGERFSLVRKELRYASDLEALGKLNFVIFSTVIDEKSLSTNIEKFYAAHTAGFHKIYFDVSLDDLEEKVEDSLKEVDEFIRNRKEGHPIPSVQPELPIMRDTIIDTSVKFVGRENEEKEVLDSFNDNRVIVLEGIGGIGKTEFAKKVLQESKYITPQIITFGDEEIPTLENLVYKIKYPKKVYEVTPTLDEQGRTNYLLSILKKLDDNVILLLDNVNSLNTNFIYSLLTNFSCRFLITTRVDTSFFPNIKEVKKMVISKLSLEEVKTIFENYYGKLSREEAEDFEELIYSKYSGNTQAIILIAKMLFEHGVSLNEFYEASEEYLKNNYVSASLHNIENFEPISNVLSEFFKITKFLESSEVIKDILRIMIIIEYFGIKEKDLKEMLGIKSSNEIIVLAKNGLIKRVNINGIYYLYMHSIISESLVLNGLLPSKEQIELLRKHILSRLDEEEVISSRDIDSLQEVLIKLVKFKNAYNDHPFFESISSEKDPRYTYNLNKTDILEILLDENNSDPIFLNNGSRTVAFDQIAVIPYEEEIYCILKPLEEIPGVGKHDAAVFYVKEGDDDTQTQLIAVIDEKKAVAIFKEYYRLLIEANK